MIELLLKAARPELKDNSIKQYLSSLRTLNGGQPITNVDFLKDYDAVMEKLKEKKSTTIKNYMNAIIVVLDALKMDKELVEKYSQMRDKLNAEYSDQQATHKMTDTQEKNWVPFEEYLKKVEELGADVQSLKKKSEWNLEDRRKYQEYLLAKLYTKYPLRNDYVMMVISKAAFNKLSDSDKAEKNYLVVPSNNNAMFFVLNEYKTRRKYGEKRLHILDGDISKGIKLWLKHRVMPGHNRDALFFNPKDMVTPADSSALTRILITMSKREFDGKSVGSSLIRHMYLSSKYADTVKEMEKDADLMGHSTATQQNIYTKTTTPQTGELSYGA